MSLISMDDIIGKTLIAKVNVPVYKYADDSKTLIGTVKAGNPVGVVYTYLLPNASYGRSGAWWVFVQNGAYYYTEAKTGYYNETALLNQGVITTEDKIKQEQEAARIANMGLVESLVYKYGKYVLGFGLLAILGTAIIKKKL